MVASRERAPRPALTRRRVARGRRGHRRVELSAKTRSRCEDGRAVARFFGYMFLWWGGTCAGVAREIENSFMT